MYNVECLNFEILGMKTMKYILLVICVACASTMMAVDYKLHQTSSATFKSTSPSGYSSVGGGGGSIRSISTSTPSAGAGVAIASVPMVTFRSTSSMPSTGSTLTTATPAVVDEPEAAIIPGPKRARPEDNKDPYDDPLGDAVLPLLLLAAGYVVFVTRKRRAQNGAARN